VQSVAISGPGVRDGALTVEVDQAVQLTASVYPADATDRTVSWRSSDGSVVRSVNEWIRGLKPGTATITATAGGRSATLRVTVKAKAVPVQSVAISGPGVRDGALTVEVDQAVQLTASVYPADATDRTVSWRSSDGSVVRSVNEWIRGLKPGTATITATAGGRSATLRVTVVK